MSTCDVINAPIKFLGATVLSFSTTIGLGSSSESTLSVELVEDCENGDLFLPANNLKEVGDSVFFNCGTFVFGGVLASWTTNQSNSGKTYSVRVTDPRQLLDNFVLIVDTDIVNINAFNLFNIWSYWDKNANQADKDISNPPDNINDPNNGQFGKAQSSERGMKYRQIIAALENEQNNTIIYSNTGYAYTVDFSGFPPKSLVPDFYRIQGNTTLLQLLQNICDVLGYDFYVNLLPGNIIKIGLINLKVTPGSFAGLINAFDGKATDLSYGQELRQDKVKTIIYGEKIYWNNEQNNCYMYFGSDTFEDAEGNKSIKHIVPHDKTDCGFFIAKMITSLNATLHTPIPPFAGKQNGPYSISEFDIRAAMSSMKMWQSRVFDATIPGELNAAIRARFPKYINPVRDTVEKNSANQEASNRTTVDVINNPNNSQVELNKNNEDTQDLDKVFAFVKDIGDTYYGKQFLVPLNNVSYALEDDKSQTLPYPEQANFMFTDVPTNAGGWADQDQAILDLEDPDLQFFRNDDGRVGCFAKFAIEFTNPKDFGKGWYTVLSEKDCIQCEESNTKPKFAQSPIKYKTKEECEKALDTDFASKKCQDGESGWFITRNEQDPNKCARCEQKDSPPENNYGTFGTKEECEKALAEPHWNGNRCS